MRHERSEVNVLFDMLSIFLTPTRIDYTFLKAFFMIEVPEQYTPPEKKAVLLRFLDLFRQKALSQELLVVAMQLLILPMLTYAFTHGEANDVIEEATIGIIVEHLLDPPAEVRVAGRARSAALFSESVLSFRCSVVPFLRPEGRRRVCRQGSKLIVHMNSSKGNQSFVTHNLHLGGVYDCKGCILRDDGKV